MAVPPGRPPDDCRRRHEKPPVTAPNHKSTSGYDLPPCPFTELLDRLVLRDPSYAKQAAKHREEIVNHAAGQAEKSNRGIREITAAHELFIEEQDSLRRKIHTANRRLESLADEIDDENRRGPKTITANDDQASREPEEWELLMAKRNRIIASTNRSLQKLEEKMNAREEIFERPKSRDTNRANNFYFDKNFDEKQHLR